QEDSQTLGVPRIISTIAGRSLRDASSFCTAATDEVGDGCPATDALFSSADDVAVAPDGTIYVDDSVDFRIRKIAPDGTVSTVAGDGDQCLTPGQCGDGGPAT